MPELVFSNSSPGFLKDYSNFSLDTSHFSVQYLVILRGMSCVSISLVEKKLSRSPHYTQRVLYKFEECYVGCLFTPFSAPHGSKLFSINPTKSRGGVNHAITLNMLQHVTTTFPVDLRQQHHLVRVKEGQSP